MSQLLTKIRQAWRRKSASKRPSPSFRYEELEQRVLFSSDPVSAATAVVADVDEVGEGQLPTAEEGIAEDRALLEAEVTSAQASDLQEENTSLTVASEERLELVVVDARVEDADLLIADLQAEVDDTRGFGEWL